MRREAVRKADRVEPTPETLANLQQPVSRAWGPEYEAAEIAIRTAVKLRAGTVMVRVSAYTEPIMASEASDWSPSQMLLVQRYLKWAAKLRDERIHIPAIVGMIACGDPVKWKEGLLKTALKRYIELAKRRG